MAAANIAKTHAVSYRRLGKTGLRISVPVFGTMCIGSDKWAPWVLNEDKAIPLLKAAWDAGINTFDTANMYSNGLSERQIAKFIKTYSIPREQVVIMTKVFAFTPDDPSIYTPRRQDLANTREFINQGGSSRAAIFNQVAACLSRLDTPYIDVLQVHAFDPATPLEETMKALHDLVQRGSVRYIGASNMRTWQFAEMNAVAVKNGWTEFVTMQVEHSLLYRPQEIEMFGYCNHKGIGILTYSALLNGHLARPLDTKTERTKTVQGTPMEKKLSDSDRQVVKRVEEIAEKRSLTMAQVALAWAETKVTSPIVGANSPERLTGTIVAENVLLPEDVKYLEELYEFRPYRW